MTKSTRTVILAVLGLFGLGTLATAGLAALMIYGVGEFSGSSAWCENALAERELPAVFGVRLPVKPLRYQSRSLGFQDAYFEVLVQLPPGAAELFLSTNHLVRGEEDTIDPDLIDQLHGLDPTTPQLKATTVQLPEAMKADGGSWQLHRGGELLEAPGVLWIHLTAFES